MQLVILSQYMVKMLHYEANKMLRDYQCYLFLYCLQLLRRQNGDGTQSM
jgi:hypothetical protein